MTSFKMVVIVTVWTMLIATLDIILPIVLPEKANGIPFNTITNIIIVLNVLVWVLLTVDIWFKSKNNKGE